MKLDLNQTIIDTDGRIVVMEEGIPFLLKDAIKRALVANYAYEMSSERSLGLSGEDKFKRWELATQVSKADESIEIKAEDIVLIKSLIGKFFGPVIVGPVWNMLEGK